MNNLESIFNSIEFKNSLTFIVESVKSDAKNSPNEKTIETRFDNYLYQLFQEYFVKLGYEYSPVKEKSVISVRSGRIDTALSNVLIEFKQPKTLSSKKDKESAILQTLSYLDSENQNSIKKTFALLTDGQQCAIFTVDSNGQKRYEDFVEITSEHYERLIKSILGLNQKTFDSEALVNDFVIKNNSPIKILADVLYRGISLNSTEKSQMLLKEWKSLFKLSHSDQSQQKDLIDRRNALSEYLSLSLSDVDSEYNALFSLQTAYSILIKLIAFKVVSEIKFDNALVNYSEILNANSSSLQRKMEDLESGSIIRDYGVQNLLEGDFFSWYSSEQQWNEEISTAIKLIVLKLNKYTTFDFFSSNLKAKDFFKNLYQTVIPKSVRHSLGEYYTPYWLANHVIEKTLLSVDNNQWRALDPTCGSGTFITVLIDKVINETKEKHDKGSILKAITSRVIGIDLNPLAVLTARVNYFLNIAQFMSFDSEIEIPIYSGDSAYTPEVVSIDGVKFIKYSLNTNIPVENGVDTSFPVYFPEVGLRNLKKFSRCMIDIELDIKLLSPVNIFNRLMSLMPYELKENVTVCSKLEDLSNSFVRFESNNWNGIWARIIANYLTTSKLGKFDAIVGNPPWVDWKNLPSEYREKIKSLDVTNTIFSGDYRTGGINLNIAALITNVVASNWLDEKGVMGLLMPDTFLVQKTYEGYRKLLLSNNKKAYFKAIDDWSKAGNPFDGVTQKFYTYYITKTPQNYQKGIPIDYYQKLRGVNSQVESLNFEASFSVEKGKAIQTSKDTTNFCLIHNDANLTIENLKLISSNLSDYRGREGVEFYPQELVLYEYVESGRETNTTVTLKNVQVKKSKFKVPQSQIFIEKIYLKPLVRGVDITPFNIDSKYIVPFAYDSEYSKRVAIKENVLREKSPLLFKHFSLHKELFESQNHYSKKIINGSHVPYYSMARVGDYTFAPYHVAFRDNTRNVACVVSEIEMPWGERVAPVFQNHAVTISQRPNGEYISLDEAYYIAGIINSDIVCEFVKISSDGRSYPIHPRYRIPLYGNEKILEYQNKIIELSKKAHSNYFDKKLIKTITKEISSIYLEMLQML